MRRAQVLAELNRRLLETYSRQTTTALRARLPLPVALPWLDELLKINVDKEVRKDALTLERAFAAARQGRAIDEALVSELVAAARAIDRDFLARAKSPLVIAIPYAVIEPLRRRRIRKLLALGHGLAMHWRPRVHFSHALGQALAPEGCERFVQDLLKLYAEETRALGEAVRMPALLVPLRQRVLTGLYETMARTAALLAREAALQLMRRETCRRRAGAASPS